MKIVCPQCETAYDVKPATLGSEGRQVRCARCQNVWFAEIGKPEVDVIPAAGTDAFGEAVPVAAPDEPSFSPPDADFGPAADTPDAAAEAPGPEPAFADPEMPAAPGWEEAPAVAAADVPPPDEAPEVMPPAEPADEPAPSAAAADLDEKPAKNRKRGGAPQAEAPDAKIEASTARRPVTRRPKRAPHPVWHARGLTAAIVILITIDAGLILGRTDIVRTLPQTASLYQAIGLPVNLRDFTFKDIKTTQEQHDGSTILIVDGTIVATGHKEQDVPRLRFAISAANGHEIYAWTALPSRTRLAPGEALPFRTRLASPPEQGRIVKVRFFNRRDIAAGLR